MQVSSEAIATYVNSPSLSRRSLLTCGKILTDH